MLRIYVDAMVNVDLLTTAEAAARAGLPRRTFLNLVTSGEITPAAKAPGVRGAFFFVRDDVERLRKERATKLQAELADLAGGESL